MNRKQWMVLGIGLILLSFFISITSGINSKCEEIQKSSIDTQLKAIESGGSIEEVTALGMDNWVISCFDMFIYLSVVSTIIFTLGIIFVILGFLEPKNKY